MFISRKNNCKYRKLFEYFRHFLHDFPWVFLLKDNKVAFIECHVCWLKSLDIVKSQSCVMRSLLSCFPYKTAVQADQLGCRNRDRRWVILSVISAVTTGWRISESAEPGNFKIKMSWTETRGIKFVLLYSSSMYDLKNSRNRDIAGDNSRTCR